MRKFIIIVGLILFGCADSHVEKESAKKTDEKESVTRALNANDYAELSRLFAEDIRLKEDGRVAYDNYQKSLTRVSFSHSRVLSLGTIANNSSSITKILIVVESSIYGKLTSKIRRYANDINKAYGCAVIMETVSGGDHNDIKNLIVSNQVNLNGAVFIGDIRATWYENSDDHNTGKPDSWPCDLYYMDINGVWSDGDGDGRYDSHTGNVQPEIFVGRISTKNMGTLFLSEELGLEQYLDKNHMFWNGDSPVNSRFGLSYTDKDWASYGYFKTNIGSLYGVSNYDAIAYGASSLGRADYLGRLKNNRYEFIQLACHSSYNYLSMSGGGIYANEIFNNGTEAIGYNLFCCSACDWTAVPSNSSSGFLGGAHVYNSNNSSLVAVGSTKTGGMLGFDHFYNPLGQGKTIGESLKSWWITAHGTTHSTYIVSWFYGMTIIGDPMVNFRYRANDRCVSQITLNGFDTSNNSSRIEYTALDIITLNNYKIPAGKHVVFSAPTVIVNNGFECHQSSSFEIKSEGCL